MLKDKIKGFVAGIVATSLLFSLSISVFSLSASRTLQVSYDNIKIYIDQNLITPKDVNGDIVEPFIYDGTVYLPARALSEALGKDVSWNSTAKSVYVGIQPQKKEYTLIGEYMGSKNYVAGKDFPAGVYTIEAILGTGAINTNSGNSDVFMATSTAIEDLIKSNNPFASLSKTNIYNVWIDDGEILTVKGSLTIKMTPVN